MRHARPAGAAPRSVQASTTSRLKDTASLRALIRAHSWRDSSWCQADLRRISRPGGRTVPQAVDHGAARCLSGQPNAASEDELVSIDSLPAFRGWTRSRRPSDFRRPFRAAVARGQCVGCRPPRKCGLRRECLRYVSPVQMTKPRFATRDVVWQGRQFRRGDMLAGFLAAANADPVKFEHPHRFDITRHPNPHLSFGTGAHFCLGFQLARVETAIAFERILARFPNMRLAAEGRPIAWRKRLGIRALVRLPVQLSA